jgi:hypothetical protein
VLPNPAKLISYRQSPRRTSRRFAKVHLHRPSIVPKRFT